MQVTRPFPVYLFLSIYEPINILKTRVALISPKVLPSLETNSPFSSFSSSLPSFSNNGSILKFFIFFPFFNPCFLYLLSTAVRIQTVFGNYFVDDSFRYHVNWVFFVCPKWLVTQVSSRSDKSNNCNRLERYFRIFCWCLGFWFF